MRVGAAQAASVLLFALVAGGCSVKEKIEDASSGTGSSSGTASAPRVLSFVAAPTVSLGNVPIGSTKLIFVSIATTGSGNATISSTSNSDSHFTYNGGSFPGTGGTCTQPIQGNCSIALLFTAPTNPGDVGPITNDFTINYSSDDVDRSVSLGFSANATLAANLVVNGAVAYDFGTKNVATSTDATLTVQNTGLITASSISGSGLSAPLTFKGGAYPGTGGTCGTALISSATCTVVVTYAPVSAGVTAQTLDLDYNDGTGLASATLGVSGTAVTLASLVITAPAASPFDYGTRATTAPALSQTFTIQNTGGQAATSLSPGSLSAPFSYSGGTFPGGGTCVSGGSLAAGASCTVIIDFDPTAAGSFSDTFSLAYADGSGGADPTLTRGIIGTGVGPAVLSISNPVTYDFGSKLVGTSTDFAFTVTNTGSSAATSLGGSGLAAPFTFAGGTFPGTGGTCTNGGSLAAGANCSVVVRFTPSAAGAVNDTMQIDYNDGGAVTASTRPLTGTGFLQAILSITSPTSDPYDFGTRTTNATQATVTFTLQNTGNGTATALGGSGLAAPFRFAGGGAFPGTGGTCTNGGSLAAGASCTVVLGYLPTVAGTWTDTVNFNYNDGVSATSISRDLQGVAVLPASLSISDGPTYDYGSKVTGTTTDYTFTVTNGGGAAATALSGSGLAAPFTFAGGTFPGTGGTCTNGGSLAAGANCTIVIRYSPTTVASHSDTVLVNYNDGGANTSTNRALTGTGIQVASLAVTSPAADPYDFGTLTVGDAAVDVTVTVTNNGNGSATSITPSGLATPFSYKDGVFPGTGGTCVSGGSLAAAASCTIVVSYLPTSAGTWSDTMELTYVDGSGGANPTLSHGFQGIAGTAAFLTISDGATYDFGSKTVGSSTDHLFVVQNTGGTTATSMAGAALAAPFTYKGGTYPGAGGGTCGTTLVAGASCFIHVNYSPTLAGGHSTTLTVDYDDGLTTTHVDRPITGTGGTVANLSLSDLPSYSYGTVARNYTSDKTITVTNLGGSTATGMSGSGLAAPFTFKGGGGYPGTDGTCGSTLAAGASCTMVVTFAPTAAANSNDTLQLDYDDGSAAASTSLPLAGTGASITKITGGSAHTCALYSNGVVKCWGSNSSGQLGDGTTTDSASPVLVSGISTATDIAAGSEHTCALLSSNRIQCWGSDDQGQLGDDATLANRTSPTFVATYSDFTALGAGGDLSCGLRSGQTVVCWGSDDEGGNGDNAGFSDNPTPVAVSGLTQMASISVGRAHACGHRTTGFARCWGSGDFGQLGNNASNDSGIPVTPTGLNDSAGISVGGDTSCVIHNDGTVSCWGADDVGQLGNNAALANQDTPTAVNGLTNATSIALGAKHGCAKASDNTVLCWGYDFYGQLGNDTNYTNVATPASVSGLANVSHVGVGENHSCAVLTTGAAYCWGSNASKQLGDGTVTATQPTPVSVLGL